MRSDFFRLRKIVGPLVLLVVWQIVSVTETVNPLLLPSASAVAIELWAAFFEQSYWQDVFSTLAKAFASLGIASAVGIPLGLLFGYSDKVYAHVEFLIEFFRAIPATALFPLFMLALGVGNTAKVGLVIWAIIFTIVIYTMYGVQFGKRTRRKVAQVMGFSGVSLFTKFILPDALPHMAAGMRIAISTALVLVVVTEMFIGSSAGIGDRIMDTQRNYQIAEMYVAIITIGAIGYILNTMFKQVEKRYLHWAGR